MLEFKLIVAGGRDFNDWTPFNEYIWKAYDEIREHGMTLAIVSGGARGADSMGSQHAIAHGIQLYTFPADWNKFGKSAGFIRNKQMAEFSDGLLAFWDSNSKGTAHMIRTMQELNKPTVTVSY